MCLEKPSNSPLQRMGASVAALPLAPAAERQIVGQTRRKHEVP